MLCTRVRNRYHGGPGRVSRELADDSETAQEIYQFFRRDAPKMSRTIVQFPRNFVGRPALCGATRYEIYREWLKIHFCRLLNSFGLPGGIRDTTITDELTGQYIEVMVGVLFTRLSVNGRDYYFRRLSGRFDGTGMGCC